LPTPKVRDPLDSDPPLQRANCQEIAESQTLILRMCRVHSTPSTCLEPLKKRDALGLEMPFPGVTYSLNTNLVG